MENHLNTLALLAQLTTAFVSFAVIVATLRMTLGTELKPFQKLLVQFFTVSGMFGVSIMLLPIVLAGFFKDETIIVRYSILYTFLLSSTYLVIYVRQRIKISANTPLPSLFVMVGYGLSLPLLAISGTGIYWQPSLAILSAYSYWILFSGVTIFVYFLHDFVHQGD